VSIIYESWKTVLQDFKDLVCAELNRRFMYTAEGYDEEKCNAHVMYVVGKALRNFKYKLNKDYMEKGNTPFEHYNYVMTKVWEVFTKQKQTSEAKSKSKQFLDLTKRNINYHHLGLTRYAS
jgi:hypothetical protein